jgi:hypothetical protein
VEIFVYPGDIPAEVEIAMGFGGVWINEVIIVDPFVFVEQVFEHVVDVLFDLFWISRRNGFESFVENHVILA